MNEVRSRRHESETPLKKGYRLGGWSIEITAPLGVTDFYLMALDLRIREYPNSTVDAPIDIHLRAEAQ